MKVLIVFGAIIAYATGQFGGFFPNVPSVPSVPSIPNIPNVPSLPSVPGFGDIPVVSNVQNFAEFAAQTGKQYASEVEKAAHAAVFEARKQSVDSQNELFNLGKSTFQSGLNFFSDLPLDQILKGLTGLKKSAEGDAKAAPHKTKATPPPNVGIPDSFDWREKGGVTPVKFQGLECGACWSFATTGAIEGHIFRKTGQLINLSEQNLVDCGGEYDNTGCDGGFQEYGFAYVSGNKGISRADSYPFVEKTESCKYDPSNKAAEIKGYDVIPPGDENKMKEVIATLGPLACSLNAAPDSFVLYKTGIYDDDECNKDEVNHSILVVGYGSENGADYWIIKNSWTDKWGENGFMKLPRNKKSFCGIANECSYPIV